MRSPALGFGRRLRAHRERLGIPLEVIAASTKISVRLLADLERDDVSRWPQGIFRRAFVREYALAVRLPPEQVLADFSLQFPDHSRRAPNAPATADAREGFQLTLAYSRRDVLRSLLTRGLVAAVEACVVVIAGYTMAWMTRADFRTTCAALALTYYSASAACLGRSVASWWATGGRLPRPARGKRSTASADTRELLHIVARQADVRRRDRPSREHWSAEEPGLMERA